MNKLVFNCTLFISLLIASSCASKTYEWVKINPEEIPQYISTFPYSETIRRVDVVVSAKYREDNIIYIENSTDYFDLQSLPKEKSRKLIAGKSNKALNAGMASRSEDENLDAAMNRLNNAIIYPKSKRIVSKHLQNAVPVREESLSGQSDGLPNNSSNTREAKENFDYDDGLNQLKNHDLEINKNELEGFNTGSASNNKIHADDAKRNNSLWVGLVLLIIGLIVGLIFGGFSFLISVVGIAFLVVGYFTKA